MQTPDSLGRRPRRRNILGTLLAAALLTLSFAVPAAQAGVENFSFEMADATVSTAQAGAHADFETRWKLTKDPVVTAGPENRPWASMRDVVTELPPGLFGNPAAFPTCDAATFVPTLVGTSPPPMCPTDTQVGMIDPGAAGAFVPGLFKGKQDYLTPLINLEPPPGDPHIVARLGFVAVLYPEYIDIRLDPKRENALTSTLVNTPSIASITGSYNRLWADPTDESHDLERFNWLEAIACGFASICNEVPVDSGLPPTPFMVNPSSCGPSEVGTAMRSYEVAEGFEHNYVPLADFEGCESVPFEPTLSLAPTTRSASAPSGIDVNLHIPQDGLKDPEGLGSSQLREAVVRLPEGITLNASAVDGLGSCSEEQIGVDRIERQVVDYESRSAPVVLSFGGQTTAELPQIATAEQVRSALEALPNIAPGDIAVSGRPGGPWTIDFVGSYAGQDVAEIGGTHSEVQEVGVAALGGTYTLTYDGQTTGAIALDADAAALEAALEALPNLEPGELEVIGGPSAGVSGTLGTFHQSFRVVFRGDLAQSDVAALSGTSSLTGGGPFSVEARLSVSTFTEGASAVKTHTVKQGGSIGFTDDAPACPDSSKIATGEVSTPVLRDPLRADVYIAKQADNPFDSLFAGYLAVRGSGVMIKVPAKIDVDPHTGQITTTFGQNPQQPFEDLELHFKGGNRGLLSTPEKCGTYAVSYELHPWSGNPAEKAQSEFSLDQSCEAKPFAPGFHVGSETALAGSFTTFATQVTNEAGAPDLRRITVDLPEGVSASLAGVSICPDAALGSLPTAAGTGTAQIASPSCPANSQIGTVQAGTGSGAPFYVRTGKVYLAGPYKGAPLSLAVITPAVAGPFDLGNVLVRVPVSLDQRTARAHAASDQIPTMLAGVPLDLRDIRVLLDRQGFALNPTSCEPKAATGVIEGSNGQSASVSDRFQVGECAALGFKPKLGLRLKGGTQRGDHPALTAVFRPRPGDANTARIQVALPKSEFLDQSHIGTVCTRVQFAADACPRASIYGKVIARTPLLDQPLAGNVYLRSSSHELPDLVTDLRGPANQPIHLEAVGRIDSVDGGIRTTFEFVPDAPITKVTLKMKGGRKGLLQNSRNICAQTFKASAAFAAHNGRTLATQPKMQARCKAAARKGKGKGKSRG